VWNHKNLAALVRADIAVHVGVQVLVDSHRVGIKQQWHGGELDNGEHDQVGAGRRQGGACIAFEHRRENCECAGLCAKSTSSTRRVDGVQVASAARKCALAHTFIAA